MALLALTAQADKRRSVRSPEPVFNANYTEGGYADRTSVAQGEQISFHIATSVSPFNATIVNLADNKTVVRDLLGLTSTAQNCSGRYTSGCGWGRTATISIPGSWPSGYYAVTFPTSFGPRKIIFVVRENIPGSTSPIVVISPTNTYQAYNDFGGRSLYPTADPNRGSRLSFERPYVQDLGIGRFDIYERKFVDWMREERRTFEVITDQDLENPNLLSHYKLALIVGHSEYWTSAARENLENFSRSGGHIAIFGGNTMWWQVRYEDNGHTLVGYKDAVYDPMRAANEQLVTTHFWNAPINDPENTITGLSSRLGGYANRVNIPDVYELLPLEQRIGYTVTEPQHWVFSGTGVSRGTEFGREIAGLEVDGTIYNCAAGTGVLFPDGSDATPLNTHILAVTPSSDGHGTIAIYTNSAGGVVFNAGTQNWVYGLASDPIVQIATRNLLDRLSLGVREVYDGVNRPILAEELFNCPQNSQMLLPGWRSTIARGDVTSACAYEGPAGLQLSGAAPIAISRNFTPAGTPRDQAEVRFYARMDDFQKRARFPSGLVTLRYREGDNVTNLASVEFDVDGSTRRTRISRRNAAGTFFASDWISLPNGWHLIELSWRSAGTITLQVDGGTSVSLQNPDTQVVSDIVIEYPQADFADSGMACIDALAVGIEKLGSVPPVKP
ncbi:MAG TPA: N,N-dimethylformamidase beta subunit family domain-containing protein [Thermoanaerobaculia bacterium]|nr:N,N-dimethylformamidase beta subunit family domain-containing protein [Thermoanaerobaculia bacterium]